MIPYKRKLPFEKKTFAHKAPFLIKYFKNFIITWDIFQITIFRGTFPEKKLKMSLRMY